MYKITLANGMTIDNLSVNGTNFISPTKIDTSIMTEKNLSPTIIEHIGDDEDFGFISLGKHENMRFFETYKPEGEDGYWFALVDIPKEEIFQSKMYADIQYIAMMTDVDIL